MPTKRNATKHNVFEVRDVRLIMVINQSVVMMVGT